MKESLLSLANMVFRIVATVAALWLVGWIVNDNMDKREQVIDLKETIKEQKKLEEKLRGCQFWLRECEHRRDEAFQKCAKNSPLIITEQQAYALGLLGVDK